MLTLTLLYADNKMIDRNSGKDFSHGQWQLLSIARAVVSQHSLLLLDEITANLDAETEKMVLQALRRAAEHRTVISVSHRTSAELGRTSGKYSIGGSYNLVQGNSRL